MFIVVFLIIDYPSKPIADYLNNKLDVIYESYKQEEQKLTTPTPSPEAAQPEEKR